MKRIVSALAALAVGVTLAACGGSHTAPKVASRTLCERYVAYDNALTFANNDSQTQIEAFDRFVASAARSAADPHLAALLRADRLPGEQIATGNSSYAPTQAVESFCGQFP